MKRQGRVFWIGLLAIGVSLAWGTGARAQQPEEELHQLLKLFVDTFDQVDRNYVKEVSRRQLLEGAVRGMLQELDPYSNYISEDDLVRFNSQVEQEFGGIGIQIGFDEHRRLMVQSPLPGSPAYKAGMRAGDLILQVNGQSTEGFDSDRAIKQLKGKPGESVKLGILHKGERELKEVNVTREMIHVSTVMGDKYKPDGTWDYLLNPEQKIGYIRISSFGRDTTKELTAALETLKSQGMKGLVLDLRFNPGGLLTAATEISDLFVEDGLIVSTKGRNTEERTWKAKKSGTFGDFPMAVLVNGYSASASEIVSACLQDNKRAAVIGDRTWGKGSVQNVIELDGGKSALKLTTASYHRPSGKNIHRFPGAKETEEWGVLPDDGMRIPQTIDDLRKYSEYRGKRDVLSDEGPPKSDYVDAVLNKAVEYVQGKMQAPEEKPAAADDKPQARLETPRVSDQMYSLLLEWQLVYRVIGYPVPVRL